MKNYVGKFFFYQSKGGVFDQFAIVKIVDQDDEADGAFLTAVPVANNECEFDNYHVDGIRYPGAFIRVQDIHEDEPIPINTIHLEFPEFFDRVYGVHL